MGYGVEEQVSQVSGQVVCEDEEVESERSGLVEGDEGKEEVPGQVTDDEDGVRPVGGDSEEIRTEVTGEPTTV